MRTLTEAERQARVLVNKWTAAAAGFSWVPGSTLVLGAGDWTMIGMVANCFEVRNYNKQAIVGVLGGCLAGKTAVEVLSFIPIFGWAAKAAIASAITKTMGELVIAYFKERSPLKVVPPPQKLIAFVGKTSAGKSSAANALLGYVAFEVGVEHGTTTTVSDRDYQDGYRLRDTPGLLDDGSVTDCIREAIQEAELVVYTTDGQLYRPELDVVRDVRQWQSAWDESSATPDARRLALFVNRLDIRELTMSSTDRHQEAESLRAQVAPWIPEANVVFGSAAPVLNGVSQPAQVDALRTLVRAHVEERNRAIGGRSSSGSEPARLDEFDTSAGAV